MFTKMFQLKLSAEMMFQNTLRYQNSPLVKVKSNAVYTVHSVFVLTPYCNPH